MYLVLDELTNDVLKFFWTQEEGEKYMETISNEDNWISLTRVALYRKET